MLAVCEWLHKNAQVDHVGLVYNIQSSEGTVESLAESLDLMKPHLFSINIGDVDKQILSTVFASGHEGPIGILVDGRDANRELQLRRNIGALQKRLP